MNISRRWQPSPLIRGSIWLHALAAIAAIVLVISRPPYWPLALAGVVAAIIVDHLVLTAVGLWPDGNDVATDATLTLDPRTRSTAAGTRFG